MGILSLLGLDRESRFKRDLARFERLSGGPSTTLSAPKSTPRFVGYLNFGTLTQPVPMSFQGGDLTALLTAAAWSYSAFTKTARQVATIKPIVELRNKTDGKWIRNNTHPLNDLLEAPQGPDAAPPNWSWAHLIEVLMLHLQLSPRGALLKVESFGGKPLKLFPLDPSAVLPQEDPITGLPVVYNYCGAQYLPTELVHLVFPHPSSYTLSVPPVTAMIRAMGIDATAETRQHANLNNRVAPGSVFVVESMVGFDDELQDEQLLKLQKRFALPTQDGTPMFLGAGTKMLEPPPTSQDLEYAQTRQIATEQMLAAAGTPSQLLGAKDGPTYASVHEAWKIWYDTSIFTCLELIYSGLTRQMVQRAYGTGIRLGYDLAGSPIALAILEAKADVAQKIVNLGFPANLASDHVGLGLPHVEGLDTANTRQIVAGRDPKAGAEDDKPGAEPDEADAEPPAPALKEVAQ